MKYRKLGNSGVLVSSLSLGTMQFGRGMKMGSLGQDQTDGMVRFALDQGINLIDTADVYSGEKAKPSSERRYGASAIGWCWPPKRGYP
jgi:aryl-alcohol dehydrogenase-like predicted oxidoreductase